MDQEKGKESKTRKHRSREKECVAAECNSFECNSDESVDLVYTFLNFLRSAAFVKITLLSQLQYLLQTQYDGEWTKDYYNWRGLYRPTESI